MNWRDVEKVLIVIQKLCFVSGSGRILLFLPSWIRIQAARKKIVKNVLFFKFNIPFLVFDTAPT